MTMSRGTLMSGCVLSSSLVILTRGGSDIPRDSHPKRNAFERMIKERGKELNGDDE